MGELATSRKELTPKRQEIVLSRLMQGSSVSAAARAARVHPRTLQKVLEEVPDNPKHPLRYFIFNCWEAMADNEDHLRRKMVALAEKKGDPKYFLEQLERLYPEVWGKQKNQGSNVNIGFADKVALFQSGSPALPVGD